MKKIFLAVLAVFCLAGEGFSNEYDINGPLPQAPLEPNYSTDACYKDNTFNITVWRETVRDVPGVPLMRVTPTKGVPHVSSINCAVVQGGVSYKITGFSGALYSPTTYIIRQSWVADQFDDSRAFTLVHEYEDCGATTLKIPAGTGSTTKPDDSPSYDEGVAAGRKQCIDDPASCGITTGTTQEQLDAEFQRGKTEGTNGGIELGKEACLNDPASCGIDIDTCLECDECEECPDPDVEWDCLVFGEDLSLDIPCAAVGDKKYGFELKRTNPLSLMWELGTVIEK